MISLATGGFPSGSPNDPRSSGVLVALALSILPLLSSCATASSTPVDHAAFHDLGDLEGDQLANAVDRVISVGCGFSIARRSEQFATVYYETGWMERRPLAGERPRGVTAARTRLLIRGQRQSGGLYRALLEGENEVRTDSVPDWHTAPVTADFAAWMNHLAAELNQLAGAANTPEVDPSRSSDTGAPCRLDGELEPVDSQDGSWSRIDGRRGFADPGTLDTSAPLSARYGMYARGEVGRKALHGIHAIFVETRDSDQEK